MKGMESEHPNTWRIEITVPLGIGAELRDSLFTAVADAVHSWQPGDRVGWDPFVAAHAVYDDLAEEVGASADCAASAGAQVAREQATGRAEASVRQIGVIPPEEWCQATRPTDAHEGPHSCDLRQGHDDTVHKCPCGTDWLAA